MSETHFYVSGMSCQGCVQNAKLALQTVMGVSDSQFDLREGTAIITGDVDPQAVCRVLTEAGFPAVVKSG